MNAGFRDDLSVLANFDTAEDMKITPLVPLGCALAILLTSGCTARRQPSPEHLGEPWNSLRSLGDSVHAAADVGEKARAAGGDRENADGGRYLSEILIQQVGRGVFRDPDYPVFRPQFPESAHTGLVNPDNLYESTHIRPGADYVLRGTRGTTADVTFQVFAGTPGVNGKLRDVGTLSLDNLALDADGNFEVFVGPTAHPQNWIETDDEAGLLLVRWTYSDWASEKAGRVEIHQVGKLGVPAPNPDVGDVARKIREAGAAVPDSAAFWQAYIGKVRLFTSDNAVMKPRLTGSEGLAGQVAAVGKFSLANDEALVVSVPRADARYQGLQLGNYWFDALEWANRQTSLTGGQSHLGSDGRYDYVISATDPGVPNWLDSTGLSEGLFFLRFQGVRTPLTDEEAPTAQLVKLGDVRSILPADTPEIDAAGRRAQLATRQQQLQRRYGR
ncbi:MAG: hypothetical protein P8K76_05490 [Candidatus Binatia bacterium]|nr:hypothetical protein [Candidatus Binatia bacterium]MDG2009209.1 hypothetical protein [Candidatus Binatia bacterium]HAC80736.1 hypothetical protein [Deltaproteobacteria bacterium]